MEVKDTIDIEVEDEESFKSRVSRNVITGHKNFKVCH